MNKSHEIVLNNDGDDSFVNFNIIENENNGTKSLNDTIQAVEQIDVHVPIALRLNKKSIFSNFEKPELLQGGQLDAPK